ncbi:hypothetical protein P8C59_004903 [Phyllachora maydis]|uniref:Uncharacterized protein n=1 Tax=Phyllachora maydis TaxID=1825666 RepID=A0AAD9MDZ7_9PEZI|nr:hypothetical protein P8C59_004903 [Phyllachora maydis]
MRFTTALVAVTASVAATTVVALGTAAETVKPTPPSKPLDYIPYSLTPFAVDLLPELGAPAIGRPQLLVSMRHDKRPPFGDNHFMLDLRARNFEGGNYTSAQLYVGCAVPALSRNAAPHPGQPGFDELSFDVAPSACRAGHNNLTLACELDIERLLVEFLEPAGCPYIPTQGGVFNPERNLCNTTLRVGFMARASKGLTVNSGSGHFKMWARGICAGGFGINKKTTQIQYSYDLELHYRMSPASPALVR